MNTFVIGDYIKSKLSPQMTGQVIRVGILDEGRKKIVAYTISMPAPKRDTIILQGDAIEVSSPS